jgi:small subunit ribosomal protein S16
MPAKIRLSRHGRKSSPFYYIVVADSRAPRDGKYIDRIGSYDPGTNPATIDLDFDSALGWLQKGAQPTDTCRAILSYKGVLMKKHLLDGVKKGAFSEEEAENRFNSWMTDKEQKILAKTEKVAKSKADKEKERLEIEKKINEERAQELAKKRSELVVPEEAKEEETEATAEATETEQEITAETPKEESKEEKAEAPKEETPKEEPAEAKTEEKPKAEEKEKEEQKADNPKEDKKSE